MKISNFSYEDGFVYTGNKDLGQFFTPEFVTLFGVSLSYSSLSPRNRIKMLDPTCGNGAMLWVGHKFIKEYSGHSPLLYGIEVDKEVFPDVNNAPFEVSPKDVCLLNRDLFTTIFDKKMMGKILRAIDLIIGNPPYVRYQSFSRLMKYFPSKIRSFFSSNYPSLSQSKVVIKILKCSLIASYIEINDMQEAVHILEGKSSKNMTNKERKWIDLVKEIPGLSDLSIYTWFFSYTLLGKEGRLCFVAPNTWMSRDYGVVLKKFFFHFLKPEIVVSQKGRGWFQDIQVDTQIIICGPASIKKKSYKVKLVEMNKENLEKQAPAGFWYNLSIRPRHYGDLFIPRVNGNNALIGLNDSKEKFLVDANFSTITLSENATISINALYAYFNSTFFKFILECSAILMGGGALKVEGSLLKKLPILNFDKKTLNKLDSLGSNLKKSNALDVISEIDKICSKILIPEKANRDNFLKDLTDSYLDKVGSRMKKR